MANYDLLGNIAIVKFKVIFDCEALFENIGDNPITREDAIYQIKNDSYKKQKN